MSPLQESLHENIADSLTVTRNSQNAETDSKFSRLREEQAARSNMNLHSKKLQRNSISSRGVRLFKSLKLIGVTPPDLENWDWGKRKDFIMKLKLDVW